MQSGNFTPRLIRAEFSSSCVWQGERLFLTTTWQNSGKGAPFLGKIRLELCYYNLRKLRSHCNDFTADFIPYPHCCNWANNDVVTVGTFFNTPSTWGGGRQVFVTLTDDNGATVPFIGRDGKLVTREYLGIVDFNWNKPSPKVLAELTPVSYPINEPLPTEKKEFAAIAVGPADFAADFPALLRYDGEPLYPYAPCVLLRIPSENRKFRTMDYACSAEVRASGVTYHISGDGYAFDLVWSVENEKTTVQLVNASDSDDLELLSVEFPRFLAMGGEENYLVSMFTTGRLISAHKSSPMGDSFPFDVDNYSAVYNENLCAALSASSIDTILSDSIEDYNGIRLAALGAALQVKIANEQLGLPSIPVKADISVTVRFKHGGDWQDVGRILRAELPAHCDPIYKDAIVQKIMMAFDSFCMSIDDLRTLFRSIANMTDRTPIIAYLVGWQDGGHDYGYPVPRKMNPGMGCPENFVAFMKECKEQYNISLSFHDNFDDAYLCYDFDKDLLARDAYGDICRGWMWGDRQSYILSPKHYVESGVMAQRVKQQAELFQIHGSYHIDVVSSEIRRYDFSPNIMAAADENLLYKKKIIEEFAKYGMDVTSEVLAVPFLGTMSHTWHIRDGGEPYYRGAELIPLSPLMYHGKACYNMPSACKERPILEAMINGAQSVTTDLTKYNSEQIFAYYMLTMPIKRFDMMEIDHYEFDGDTVRAVFNESTYIETNQKEQTYTMCRNGQILSKNWVTMLQTKPDVCLAYARDEAEYTFDLPAGWETVTACCLTVDGTGDAVSVDVHNSKFTLFLPSRTPVRITRVQ